MSVMIGALVADVDHALHVFVLPEKLARKRVSKTVRVRSHDARALEYSVRRAATVRVL
jgi:hypothetical protein